MNIKRLFLIPALALVIPASASGQQDPMAIAQGAQVYSDTCARCHNARASSERTDLEWVAIVLHMRVRANLTKTQARTVLAFLQATNLPPVGAGAGTAQGGTTLPGDTPTVMPSDLRTRLIEVWRAAGEVEGPSARAEGNQR